MILFNGVGNCVADSLRTFGCETSVQPLLRANFDYTRFTKIRHSSAVAIAEAAVGVFVFSFIFIVSFFFFCPLI